MAKKKSTTTTRKHTKKVPKPSRTKKIPKPRRVPKPPPEPIEPTDAEIEQEEQHEAEKYPADDDEATRGDIEALSVALPVEGINDIVLYLDDDHSDNIPVIYAVVPPDLARCQCEWRDQSQETFGPKPGMRCDQRPTVVAFQKRVRGIDEPTGAIALCDDHKVLLQHMYPQMCYFRKITSGKIGDYI
jgi:hypothetical protein